MDPEPKRFSFVLLFFFLFYWNFSYAEQYYDPQTRRYIEIAPAPQARYQPQPLKNPRQMQRVIPTSAEIELERQRAERQRALEAEADAKARDAGNKRFDPSRFHRTEDIRFY